MHYFHTPVFVCILCVVRGGNLSTIYDKTGQDRALTYTCNLNKIKGYVDKVIVAFHLMTMIIYINNNNNL